MMYIGFQQQLIAFSPLQFNTLKWDPENKSIKVIPFPPVQLAASLWLKDPVVGICISNTGCLKLICETTEKSSVSQI